MLSDIGHSNRCGISSNDVPGAPGNSGYINLFVNSSPHKREKEELLLSVLIKYLTSFFMLKRQWHNKIYGSLPLKNQKLRALAAEVLSTCERKFTTLPAL